MRKLSLLVLALLLASGFGWAASGGVSAETESATENQASDEVAAATDDDEEGKVKAALKKIFKNEDEPEEGMEEEKAFPLTIGLDLVSRYIWRGIDFGASPAIQPYVEYGLGDKVSWGIGVWGNYSFVGPVSSEFDLYTYLGFGPVTLTFTDYFFPSEVWGGDSYFTYKKGKTGHVYELMLSLGGDKAPVYGTAAVNLGGADQDFSSYFEIGATVYEGIDIFVSAAYDNYVGWYLARGKQKFMVTQIGLSASHEIKTKKLNIPIGASVIFNPESRNAWFVASIGLSN